MEINIASLISEYYTEEESNRILELNEEAERLTERALKELGENKQKLDYKISLYQASIESGKSSLFGEREEEYLKKYSDILSQVKAIYNTARDRYKEDRKREGILEDVYRIIEAYTKEDYIKQLRKTQRYLNLDRINKLSNTKLKEEFSSLAKIFLEERHSTFVLFCSDLVEEAVLYLLDKEDAPLVYEAVKKRASVFYKEEEPEEVTLPQELTPIAPSELFTSHTASFFPVLHGRATEALALMNSKSSITSIDKVSHTATFSTNKGDREVKAFIGEFETLSGSLGVSTHKLLMTGIGQFTENNHTGDRSREVRETEVHIPLKEYAYLCGYDIEAHATTTADGKKIIEAKEAERATNALKNARKQINKDLDILYKLSLSWSETVRGKKENFTDYRIIDHKGIKKGYIVFNFAKLFSQYLILLPIGQYSEALLSLDERKPTAYNIGVQISYHLNNDNNIARGTANRLKVKTLLGHTNLPSIEEVRSKGKSWIERIKEPFETALDDLGGDYIDKNGKHKKGCKFLKEWEYIHSGGVKLTDKEAQALQTDYSLWEETLISFTLNDAPDHTARLETKAQKIEEAQTKKPRRKAKKKRG